MTNDLMKNVIKLYVSFGLLTLTQAAVADYMPDFFHADQQISVPSCMTRGLPWEEKEYNPCSEATMQDWLQQITHARDERRIRIGYDADIWKRYSLPEFNWTQSSYMQSQMMVHDRYFYDPVTHKYTVDRYLQDLKNRFGGIDAVLIWPTYPNMGIDDRNQLDMLKSMPGGLPAIKQVVADFHKANVQVLFPMMMWDQGTRDPNEPWPDAIAKTMKELNADGVNGDTQDGVPLKFSLAAEKTGHPLVFQPEGSPSDEALAWNIMTWGQYNFPFAPLVSRYKWIEPRHMVNISDRWNRNKKDDLQYAFFNGIGWESWENIWGIWNGITPRDGEATRRVATLERGVAPFLVSSTWQPYYPTLAYGVFASRWPLKDETVFTIVNRNEYAIKGNILSLPYIPGMHYFDLYQGNELTPQKDKNNVLISLNLEENGFGALLVAPNEPNPTIKALMQTMHEMTKKPLSQYSAEWKPLLQTMVDIPPIKLASTEGIPDGMVEIPGGHFVFQVTGTEIEGQDMIGLDVQYPWENSPRRMHAPIIKEMTSFYMDKTPVTNVQFKKFMDETHYHPADDLNFLKDWRQGTYPTGWENKPVTWVSLEDARAYAKWAHKRLPHEWEWQYAAQGTDGRLYPWGSTWNSDYVPVPDKTRQLSPPDNVNAHPNGASPFGVLDMVGNVWQLTDEFMDDHTRAVILRGGSHYQPQNSFWYFRQAYKNTQHSKYLLMAPAYDRAGTIGFRCVRDK